MLTLGLSAVGWGAIIVAGIILVGLIMVIAQYLGLWFQALLSNARVGLLDLIGMSLQEGESARDCVQSRIQAVKAGLNGFETNQLETHYLAGGDVRRVVQCTDRRRPCEDRSAVGHRVRDRPGRAVTSLTRCRRR
jgi:uncharacterized protein YqfA (UPF0365 family)